MYHFKISVIGSTSRGNCYLLKGDSETLIIEAGMRFSEVQESMNYEIENIVGCLVSHAHRDHSKYTKEFIKYGIDCYMTPETSKKLGLKHHRIHNIQTEEIFKVGNFEIIAFPTKHDCDGSVGFLIRHEYLGTLLFATDTYYIDYQFEGLNHILIEANYDKQILADNIIDGKIPQVVAKRVRKSHFEIDNLKDFLINSDLSQVKEIVLLHLSDGNSNAKVFQKKISEATFITTYVADSNMEIILPPVE